MAAVEDPAGLTSIESATGLACIDTDPCNDMKNTARKSTCKAAQRATPPPVVNGNAETNNGNHVVANGDGPHKRPLEEEDPSNAAKSARLQIEEMEKAQEEMTKKVSREEDMVTQNGETEVSNGSHVEDNSKDSKPSSPSPNNTNSLALTADVRDTFKGILDVAMAKVGSRRSSANDSETLLSPDSPSQGGKEDGTLKLTGEEEDTAKQENGKEDDESKSEEVEEPTESNGEAVCPEAELLDGETGEADQSGEVDEAILLSDDDGDGSKEDPAKPESKTSQPSTEVSDESSERKEKDSLTEKDNEKEEEMESENAIQSSETNEKESEENEETVTPTTAVEEKEEEKNEEEVDKVSEAGKSEKEVKDSASEEMAEEDKKDSEDESEGKARSKADIPADKVINLDDDDDNDAGDDDKGDDDNDDTKVVGESKLESDINHPIEIEDDEDNTDLKSEASDTSSTRKRGAPSPAPSDTSSTTKKSRLDKVIGRLGSAVGINSSDSPTPAATPAAESNDDEKPPLGDAEVKNDVEMTDDVSTDVKPDTTNDVKPDVTSTETPAIKSRRKSSQEVREDVKPEIKRDPKAEKKLITLSVEELNELLVKRMNAFLERSRGSLIVQLQTRIGELQTAVESWRAQAKRLAKQLDEEVARSSQRRHGGKMARRRTNSDDVRMAQLQAASLQQQGGGGGKVTVRTPPRPAGPSPQGLVNNANGPNAMPVRMAGTTVRDLLDKQRGSEPGPKGQPVQIQGNRILVPGSKLVSRNSVVPGVRPGAAVVRTVTSQPGTPSKSVIDLTDDDDRKGAEGKVVRAGGGQVAVRAPGAGSQGSGPGRPGTVLVQQMPTSGPVIVQQAGKPVVTKSGRAHKNSSVVSQPVRTAQGTTYVYTSTRPGSLAIQTAPGTSLVRPALVTATAPPALRPANQVVTLTRGPANAAVRPPPPLRSAPGTLLTAVVQAQVKHPAPLPPQPDPQPVIGANPKQPPPKPGLKISRVQSGIVLSWNMTVSDAIAHISSYQLFAYQETSVPPSTALWKKVGDVKALPLPMACTLTQFQEGNKYHFAVRAVDVHNRVGPFSDPSSIALTVINVS